MGGHTHRHHSEHVVRVPPRTQRRLLAALAPFALVTLVGLIALWPGGDTEITAGTGFRAEERKAQVREVAESPCPDLPGQENFVCSDVTVEISEGDEAGEKVSFNYSHGPTTRGIHEGDAVIVGRADPQDLQPGEEAPSGFFFIDFDRRTPLLLLGVLFSVVVIALSRWRGLAALLGLAVSLLVLTRFVLPAILEGSSPLLVACVGGAAIMFLALYLAHGFNAATTTAVLGTLASLFLTGLLALLFVEMSLFTGAGSEEATFLQLNQQQVDLQGLLLASIIIGTLGVLDDVTVTQASAVWEIRRANPAFGPLDLYRSAIRIGRDHIASTVNTLVLAYAGASLPLLILFTVSDRTLGQILNTEFIAEEIVRTLVGSVGLVASVPITTALAAVVVTSATRSHPGATLTHQPKQEEEPLGTPGSDDDPSPAFKVPRREREWRDEG